MTKFIKKYTILIVASIVIARIITATTLIIWPNLLTTKIAEGVTNKLGSEYLERGITFIFNIVFVFLVNKDMKKNEVKSTPILILTFFYSTLGVIFFYLTIAYNRFKNKHINLYE